MKTVPGERRIAVLSFVYLGAYLLAGCVIVRALLPQKGAVARVWLGCALGILLMMWLPALLAFFGAFSVKGHLLALIPLALLTAGAHFFLRDRAHPVRALDAEDRKLLLLLACVALPLTVLGGYLQFTHNLRAVNGALHVGQSTYGDLPLHLGIITSLRNAAFPPDYSILPGERLVYPFLADSFSTSFMLFGLPLRWAVVIPGTLMMAMVFSGYMILAARMTAPRKAVVLATLFVFINGGLGFLYAVDTLGVSNGTSLENAMQADVHQRRAGLSVSGGYAGRGAGHLPE